jgi:hypothetical protein
MLVGERMTRPVLSVPPETPIQEAFQLLPLGHIHLPSICKSITNGSAHSVHWENRLVNGYYKSPV